MDVMYRKLILGMDAILLDSGWCSHCLCTYAMMQCIVVDKAVPKLRLYSVQIMTEFSENAVKIMIENSVKMLQRGPRTSGNVVHILYKLCLYYVY